ncbi:MAG: 30S ribosomal protein THX [Ignavibacteriales bacterium]|nr:30S ribosomal protein THX [Ignavibacteriales bacterium]
MGKGNRRSKRGKIWRGTYGKYRRKKKISRKQTKKASPPAQ